MGTDTDRADGGLPPEDDCCDNLLTGAWVAGAAAAAATAVPSAPIELLDSEVRDLDDDRVFCVFSDELSGEDFSGCLRLSFEA